MPLQVNLRHLDAHELHLQGEIPLEELDLDTEDEVIRVSGPLQHDLTVQKVEGGLLVQGSLEMPIACECVRCLKPFSSRVSIPDWTRHLALQGEEPVAVTNDCVDLTPFVREDILLEFPQHPLCKPDCQGLPKGYSGKSKRPSSIGQPDTGSTAWDELNKLKF